ncbi:MAG: polyribonucleotide nucleotidyltransferase, partial [Leptospiraceae bacterium]|nr:polyribonucleotide nucleotidyltransferase [Leptospiraceae bacterium]
MISDIPFDGPIAGVLIGRVDGEYVVDPGVAEREKSDLDLLVAGSRNAITMIEGGAQEYTNDEMLAALEFAHKQIQDKLDMQAELANEAAVVKREVALRLPDKEVMAEVRTFALEKLRAANKSPDKMERGNQIKAVNDETIEHFKTKHAEREDLDQLVRDIKSYLHELEYEVVRALIFEENKRADGRAPAEIRDISCEIDVLPGAHGSAVFTRGQTQSLGVVTLGTKMDNQRYETLAGQSTRNFMLHYNFPPFSVGEVKRMMGPGRREIGHGNLAFRALK